MLDRETQRAAITPGSSDELQNVDDSKVSLSNQFQSTKPHRTSSFEKFKMAILIRMLLIPPFKILSISNHLHGTGRLHFIDESSVVLQLTALTIDLDALITIRES